MSATGSARNPDAPRHTALIRATHWITVLAFFALLLTGLEILISHPRFYWGETGNVMTKPLFIIPIPSSRGSVPTGYSFTMPDANGWSRYLHFQAAWLLILTGLVYALYILWTGHLRQNLVPAPSDRTWQSFRSVITRHLRREPAESTSYNALQRVTYLFVIFVLFPLIIWTGLALSPSFDSAVPFAVNILGGRQSARTLHFFVTDALVLFLIVHVAMVICSGFRTHMRAMILGQPTGHPTATTPPASPAIASTAVPTQERA